MSYAPESVVGEWTIGPRHESVFARIGEVWQYRHLLGYFATRSLQSMYKRSSLGWIWMIVRVIAPLGLTSIIFGGVLGVDPPGTTPYFLFFLCGQAPWVLFDRSLLFITRSMERNRRLIAKVYFPRLILPIATVAPALLFLGILTLILIGTDIYFHHRSGIWHIPLHPRLLLAPVAVLISLVFALAIGFFTSVLQARYRDIRFGLRYSIGFFLYATTVLYPLSQIEAKFPLMRWVVYMNPMESAIELFRFSTIGTPLEISRATMIGQLIVIAIVALSGIWFFNREEAASVDKM
jgi:lipopolysaccharide transport system permease protein